VTRTSLKRRTSRRPRAPRRQRRRAPARRLRGAGAVLTVLAAVAWATPGTAQAAHPSLKERAQAARAMGKASAPVLVYEIADFQCPYCARFTRDVLPRIDSAYIETGKVKWVFVVLPLPAHPYGWAAAEAALCAGGVAGRFWGFHDRLFANQDEWSSSSDPTPYFLAYAKQLGIPLDGFQDCMIHDSVASLIIEDVIAAAASHVNGTPTFVIDNEEMVVGVKPFDDWKGLLDKELEKKASK
jgi:protein-disulfide isomerase